MRRVLLVVFALFFGVAVVLGLWEAYRRMGLSGPSMEALLAADLRNASSQTPAIDPKQIEATCRDPARFAAVVASVRKQAADIDARSRALMHTEVQVIQEIDKKGNIVGAERSIENVWFHDGKEYRQTLERADELKKKPIRNVNRSVRESSVVQEIFPFTKPQDGYNYSFAGVERLDGQWRIRIDFSPTASPVGRFQGQAWIDPLTYEPVRFYGILAEKKPFVDQFSMLIEYGVAENGKTQTVRSVLDGSGGFAMIQKHIRSEVKLQDYREFEQASRPSEPRRD